MAILSTPNIIPSAWFNRGNPTLAPSSTASSSSASVGMDTYPYSFDPSLDKSHQIQTQSLPPAAFGLPTTATTTIITATSATSATTAQSHVPSQNNPGATTTTANTGLFNSSGMTKSVPYSLFPFSIPFWPRSRCPPQASALVI
jgi:hypothetical protein